MTEWYSNLLDYFLLWHIMVTRVRRNKVLMKRTMLIEVRNTYSPENGENNLDWKSSVIWDLEIGAIQKGTIAGQHLQSPTVFPVDVRSCCFQAAEEIQWCVAGTPSDGLVAHNLLAKSGVEEAGWTRSDHVLRLSLISYSSTYFRFSLSVSLCFSLILSLYLSISRSVLLSVSLSLSLLFLCS